MGMTSRRNYYSIEKLAHRDDYDAYEDIYGQTLAKQDGATFWPDCPPTLETSLPFDDIFQQWRSDLLSTREISTAQGGPGVTLRPSLDAGHFLCDFIYFSSLAEHWRRKRDGERRNTVDERPILFMHVPVDGLQNGRLVTISLLRAMAQSWVMKKNGERCNA